MRENFMKNVRIVSDVKWQKGFELEKATMKFLKKGGCVVEVRARKSPAQKMSGKSSRGFISGSSGFPVGFPRQTL